jgi:hypothetical protein
MQCEADDRDQGQARDIGTRKPEFLGLISLTSKYLTVL